MRCVAASGRFVKTGGRGCAFVFKAPNRRRTFLNDKGERL